MKSQEISSHSIEDMDIFQNYISEDTQTLDLLVCFGKEKGLIKAFQFYLDKIEKTSPTRELLIWGGVSLEVDLYQKPDT